ncbi:DUF4236 domain-containing protein [Acinetobacter sp. WCHAc060033]|uniref:DUF4236 domain-containing protein n=1 Tax=Acinetobacter sp. WCHAc060033 TaxID=2518624 RepID=UPI001022B455|nr:DUF4236 domain-containing protein [Acinetobacter sp. WCHAc060033]
MGFNFRKSLKIAPGVRLNITKKGISSVSLGGKGARVNLGKKGTRTTVGLPGTGLSYSSFSPKQLKKKTAKSEPVKPSMQMNMSQVNSSVPLPVIPGTERKVSILLGIGILIMPYIFAWFTLRDGYSKLARFISFGWLFFLVFVNLQRN